MVNRWFTVVNRRVIQRNGHLTLNGFISWHGSFTTVIILSQSEPSKWFSLKFLSILKGESLSFCSLLFRQFWTKMLRKTNEQGKFYLSPLAMLVKTLLTLGRHFQENNIANGGEGYFSSTFHKLVVEKKGGYYELS